MREKSPLCFVFPHNMVRYNNCTMPIGAEEKKGWVILSIGVVVLAVLLTLLFKAVGRGPEGAQAADKDKVINIHGDQRRELETDK